MNPSGLGLSNRPGTDPAAVPVDGSASSPSRLRGWLQAHRSVLALGAAGTVLVAGTAVTLLVLRGNGPGPDAAATAATTGRSTSAGTTPAPTGATGTPSARPTTSSLPSGTRNPFKPRPAASASGSSSGSAGPSAGTSAPAVTTTVTDPAVYLALFSVAADGKASFSVNGTTYAQHPGDTFGTSTSLTYHKTVKVAGATCASISYLDQTYTVCPGEMQLVG